MFTDRKPNQINRLPSWLLRAFRTSNQSDQELVPNAIDTRPIRSIVDVVQGGWGIGTAAEQWLPGQFILTAAPGAPTPLIGINAPIDPTLAGVNDVLIVVWALDVAAQAAMNVDFLIGRAAAAAADLAFLRRLTFSAAARMPAYGVTPSEALATVGAVQSPACWSPFCVIPPGWQLWVDGGAGAADMTFNCMLQVVPFGTKPL